MAQRRRAAARRRRLRASSDRPPALPGGSSRSAILRGWCGRPGRFPSGLVTFVFTDIEASTQLLRRIGDRYPPLLERHRADPPGGVDVVGRVRGEDGRRLVLRRVLRSDGRHRSVRAGAARSHVRAVAGRCGDPGADGASHRARLAAWGRLHRARRAPGGASGGRRARRPDRGLRRHSRAGERCEPAGARDARSLSGP